MVALTISTHRQNLMQSSISLLTIMDFIENVVTFLQKNFAQFLLPTKINTHRIRIQGFVALFTRTNTYFYSLAYQPQ